MCALFVCTSRLGVRRRFAHLASLDAAYRGIQAARGGGELDDRDWKVLLEVGRGNRRKCQEYVSQERRCRRVATMVLLIHVDGCTMVVCMCQNHERRLRTDGFLSQDDRTFANGVQATVMEMYDDVDRSIRR